MTTDRYEASRGLFATAELLVLFSQHNESYITQKNQHPETSRRICERFDHFDFIAAGCMCEAFSKIFLVFLTSAFTVDLMIKVVPITASIQQSLSPSPRYYRGFFRIPRYYRNTISMPILIFFLQANFSPYGFVYTLTYCNHVTPVSTVVTVDFCYTYPHRLRKLFDLFTDFFSRSSVSCFSSDLHVSYITATVWQQTKATLFIVSGPNHTWSVISFQ